MYDTIPDDVIALLHNPNVRSVVIDYGTATLADGTRGYSVNIVTRGPSDDARATLYLEGPAASLYENLWPVMHAAGYSRRSGWLDSVRGRVEGGAQYARED